MFRNLFFALFLVLCSTGCGDRIAPATVSATAVDWRHVVRPGMSGQEAEAAIRQAMGHDRDNSHSTLRTGDGPAVSIYPLGHGTSLRLTFGGPQGPAGNLQPTDRVARVEVLSFDDYKLQLGDRFTAAALIHQAPSLGAFNPAELMRVCAALRALGKDAIIDGCRAYLSLTRIDDTPAGWQDTGDHDLDEQRIFWVLRLTFTLPAANTWHPPGLGGCAINPDAVQAPLPLFPLVVSSGVPFTLTNGYVLAGMAEPPDGDIELCASFGTIADPPAGNPADPVTAADALFAQPWWPKLAASTQDSEYLCQQIQQQALLSVVTAWHTTELGKYFDHPYACACQPPAGQDFWQEMKLALSRFPVEWHGGTFKTAAQR